MPVRPLVTEPLFVCCELSLFLPATPYLTPERAQQGYPALSGDLLVQYEMEYIMRPMADPINIPDVYES